MKIIILLISLMLSLQAVQTGELSFYVMKDGKPLSNQEVIIFQAKDTNYVKHSEYKTDKDGYVDASLPVGQYQLQLFSKEQNKLQAFVKKNFIIEQDKESQLIVSLKKDNSILFEDEETPGVVAQDAIKTSEQKKEDGFIQLNLTSSEDQKSIKDARVFVKGFSIDLKSDDKGNVLIKIPDGNQTISIIHSDFSSQTIKVTVIAKETVNKFVELTPAAMELEEFVVLAPQVKGSITAVMAEEKNSNSISNFIGSEQMSKQGDSNAASALKRVTGVTLVGGKSIYVRGLGDRYSNVEMNSLPIPSPNPSKRVVPLDIFASSVIDSMQVQKSATANIPSNFGGGYVNIRTKSKSDENLFKISFETKANSNTGKSVDTYTGGGSDWSGYDDGYRAINPDIINNSQVVVGERINSFTTNSFTKEQLSSFTKSYANRDYSVTSTKLPVGFKALFEGAYNIDIDDKNEITLFANYSYIQDNKFKEESYYKYDMEKSTGKLYTNPSQYGNTRNTVNEYKHTGMFNIGYNYSDALKLKYTKLYTHNADKTTRIVNGIMGSNDENMTKYYLDWEERTLDVNQINGDINYEMFDLKNNLVFGTELAYAKLYQPNNYQYTYRNEGEPFLDNTISNNIANKLTSNDELFAFFVNNKINLDIFSEEDYIDAGISMSSKTRESKQNKYYLRKMGTSSVSDQDMTGSIESIYDKYVRTDALYDDRAFIASSLFKAADYFDASVDETNIFLNTFFKPAESIEILLGARQVNLNQTVYQYKEDSTNPDMSVRKLIQKVPEELNVNEIYPSMNLKYKHNKNNHYDFGYSKTYIVPDLREFTNGEYFHPYEVATVLGNPELVNTNIHNFDLKYSHYFSDKENIKFGLFYKYLDKPIEDVMIPSSSLPIYSFDNANSATITGIEIDGRKYLDFIMDSLENYYVAGNFSYADSDVSLREEQIETYSNNHRQLQGLSQVVINLILGYEADYRSVTLSYNQMGERIRKVGMIDDGDKYPDYNEVPADILDFVWLEKYGESFNMRLKLGNLLNQETIWKQSSNITNKYKNGRTYSLSANYKF